MCIASARCSQFPFSVAVPNACCCNLHQSLASFKYWHITNILYCNPDIIGAWSSIQSSWGHGRRQAWVRKTCQLIAPWATWRHHRQQDPYWRPEGSSTSGIWYLWAYEHVASEAVPAWRQTASSVTTWCFTSLSHALTVMRLVPSMGLAFTYLSLPWTWSNWV